MSPATWRALFVCAVLSYGGCVPRWRSQLDRFARAPEKRHVVDHRRVLADEDRHALELRAAEHRQRTGQRLFVVFTESFEPTPKESLAALVERWALTPNEGVLWIATEDRRAAYRMGPAFGADPFGEHFAPLSLHVVAGHFAEAASRAFLALEPETKAHAEVARTERELARRLGLLHSRSTPLGPCVTAYLGDVGAQDLELRLGTRGAADGGVQVEVTSEATRAAALDRCLTRVLEDAGVSPDFEATLRVDGARPDGPDRHVDVTGSLPDVGPPRITFAVLPGKEPNAAELSRHFAPGSASRLQLSRCYAAANELGPEAHGGISLRLFVSPRGEVLSITPLRIASTVSRGETLDCLLEATWRMKLPPATERTPRRYDWTVHFVLDD